MEFIFNQILWTFVSIYMLKTGFKWGKEHEQKKQNEQAFEQQWDYMKQYEAWKAKKTNL